MTKLRVGVRRLIVARSWSWALIRGFFVVSGLQLAFCLFLYLLRSVLYQKYANSKSKAEAGCEVDEEIG